MFSAASSESEVTSSESIVESDSTEDSDLEMVEENEIEDSHQSEPKRVLQTTLDSFSPPIKYEDLVGKWYDVAFQSKSVACSP